MMFQKGLDVILPFQWSSHTGWFVCSLITDIDVSFVLCTILGFYELGEWKFQMAYIQRYADLLLLLNLFG